MNRVDHMNEIREWATVLGVNGGVFATVSLTELELGLKCLLLALSCVWSAVRVVKLIKDNE
jgi:hypothetical protein